MDMAALTVLVVLLITLPTSNWAQQSPLFGNPFGGGDQLLAAATTFSPFGSQPNLPGGRVNSFQQTPADRRAEEGWWHLYAFGERTYDVDIARRPWNDRQIDLDFFLPFYGFRYNYTFVFPEGFIAFAHPHYIQPPYTFPRPQWPAEPDPSLIAPFMIDQSFMAVGQQRISNVWYRVVHRPANLIGQISRTQPGQLQSSTIQQQQAAGFASARSMAARFGGQQHIPDRYYRGQKLRTTYGYMEDPEFLDQITSDLRSSMVGARGFTADYALVVTWERMAYGGAPKATQLQLYDHVKRWQNTYQMIVMTDEIRTYVMFNYANINWTSATSAGALSGRGGKQSATVGFNGGNGTGFYHLPYSAEGNSYKLVQLGSTPVAGRWVARVDETIVYGGCSNASTGKMLTNTPMIEMLGGESLNVSGPCFRPNNIIKLAINELTVDCTRIDMVMARCYLPTYQTFRVGWTGAAVSIDGGASYPYWTDIYLMPPHLGRKQAKLINDPINPTNNWRELAAEQLTLRWPSANITNNPSATIDILLMGYWEDTMYHEMDQVGLIASNIANTGEYTFQVASLDKTRMLTDAWCRYTGGLVQVRVSLTNNWENDYGDLLYWSDIIPFGWYFRDTWQYELGSDWALDKCLEWFEWDGRRENFIMDLEQTRSCPCHISQAVQDLGRFWPMAGCDMDGDSECTYHVGQQHCVVSTSTLWTGSGQACCYGHEGWLTFSDDYEYESEYLDYYVPGTPMRAHMWGAYPYKQPPYVPSLSHFYNEVMPFEMCCKWAGHCEFFYWRRQSSGCQEYVPLTNGFVYGDSHFITFDGLKYSFQGRGYYVLSQLNSPDHDLMVQIRAEQPPKTKWGTEVPATVITGLAATDNGSAKVEVFARKTFRRWRYATDVYVDGARQFLDTPIKQMYIYNGVVLRKPARNMDMSEIHISFSTGVGIIVRESRGMLAVQLMLPHTYNSTAKQQNNAFGVNGDGGDRCQTHHQTAGLLGTFNGQASDDLSSPDCRITQVNYPQTTELSPSQLAAIYRDFGQTWRADGLRFSILFDPIHKALYNPPQFAEPINTFQPTFDIDRLNVNQSIYESFAFDRNTVELECQGSYTCKYDYIVTGRKEYAMETLNNEKMFEDVKENSEERLISCGNLAKGIGVKKYPPEGNFLDGVTVTFSCTPEYFLHGKHQRTCVNGTWSPGWWAWCRSRNFEYFLKWLVGILSTAAILLVIAGIFLVCFIRRRKYNTDYNPSAFGSPLNPGNNNASNVLFDMDGPVKREDQQQHNNNADPTLASTDAKRLSVVSNHSYYGEPTAAAAVEPSSSLPPASVNPAAYLYGTQI